MSQVIRFFNDGSYTANDINDNFYNIRKKLSGIVLSANNDNNDMLHSASATYQSTIKAGVAWKIGAFFENTSDATLTHDAVTSTYKRIDRIVFRLGATELLSGLVVIKGAETTGTPSAPTIIDNTDILVSQVLIDNTTGTPAYTITDERQFIFYSDSKKLYVTDNLTLSGVYSDLEIYANAGTAKTINISAGAVSNNSGSGIIQSLFPKCFCKNLGAGTITLRIKTGGTGTGYDITLLQYEWVQLHWDGSGWFVINDDFSSNKVFVYTTAGAISHTVPAGRRSATIIVTGGGAGGARDSAGIVGSGGGAGGTAIKHLYGLSPAAVIAGTVGAGGAGRSTNGDGNAGVNSVFNATIIGNGGALVSSPVGMGGTASGGTINITGGNGGWDASTTNVGGSGGASYWGGGGRGGIGSGFNAVEDGTAFGSGGGGAAATTTGKGADGIIVVKYGNAQ